VRTQRAWLAGVILLSGLGASALLCLLMGAVPLSLAELWDALRGRGDETARVILWELRLPRVLTAILVGGVLGCVGCAFQGLLRNSLADPYIVGVSSGRRSARRSACCWGGICAVGLARLRCWRSAAGC
jgi:ABC-type Fe3+-siderophore transport system permease subunit